MTNELLRQHVTRVGFDLTLTKTQVAVLVGVDVLTRTKDDGYYHLAGSEREFATAWRRVIDRHFVIGMRGCEERGLVVHDARKANLPYEKRPQGLRHFYRLTKAGKAAVVLLREAGIYEEVERDLAWPLAAAAVNHD